MEQAKERREQRRIVLEQERIKKDLEEDKAIAEAAGIDFANYQKMKTMQTKKVKEAPRKV